MLQASPLFLIICSVISLQQTLVYGRYSCNEKQRNICNHLSQLQIEVDANTADLTKWNNHYGFLEGLHSNFRRQIARIVEDMNENKLATTASDLKTDEIMEKINSIEETLASVRLRQTDTENALRAIQSELQEFQISCWGEPPSVTNGKHKEFERKPGSSVQYECDKNYFMTRNSTVFCSLGVWKGHPPLCSYFDATFTLKNVINSSRVITCYSDENYDKIEFLRVRASQQREDLQNAYNYSQNPDGKYARLEVPSSLPYGAYECKFSVEHAPMSILLLKQFSYQDVIPTKQFKVANIGDTVEFKVEIYNDYNLPIKWEHNGVAVPSWNDRTKVEISNVKPSDAGFYASYYQDRISDTDDTLIRLVVRKCKANLYGKDCDQICPTCYNGGICHDDIGICICPAGFTGTNCEIACGGGRFGVNCTKLCDAQGKEVCFGHMFCKPDPLGCACAAGFTGYRCREACEEGWYGAGCTQPYHCASGNKFCNRFTGACQGGCSDGWRGDSCQIEDLKI